MQSYFIIHTNLPSLVKKGVKKRALGTRMVTYVAKLVA